MKKFVCFLLCICAAVLCGCSNNDGIAAYDDKESPLPTYITRLYPRTNGDTRYAVLMRRYNAVETEVAVSDTLGGDMKTVYTLPDGTLSYELYAGNGIIAFYRLTSYTDGSIGYALTVIDTENDNKVTTPYSKTVTAEGEIQTRFLVVFNKCVYYLTASPSLNRCRVMKYEVETDTLTEFMSYELTENTATMNHSCTFISENNGYLICGTVKGYAQTLKIYNLRTGNLVKEKALPSNVGVAYCADYDNTTGLYAIYYCEMDKTHALTAEKVGYMTDGSDEIYEIFTAQDGVYIGRETVKLFNNVVYFNIEDGNAENVAGMFDGALANIVDNSVTRFSSSLELWIEDSTLYNLAFDKKSGYDKMILSAAEIK